MKTDALIELQVIMTEAGVIHDATTIAYLIDSSLFTVKEMFVEVDINRGPSYGRTVCDESNVLKETPNEKVGTGIDNDRFFDLVEECIKMYQYKKEQIALLFNLKEYFN